MLWLIQRDFLEGQSVQQMVTAALEPVPNPGKDADIEQACPLQQEERKSRLWERKVQIAAGPFGYSPSIVARLPRTQIRSKDH